MRWVSALVFVFTLWSAYYVWWPFVFIAPAAFAVTAFSCRSDLGAFAVAVGSGFCFFVWGQWFLAAFSLAGLLVLAAWQAITLGFVAIATRWWRRRTGTPLAVALPITWVGGEFVRMLGPFGFPGGSLALPCHGQLWMIQVSDLTGFYGVSAAVAMIGGFITDLVLDLARRKKERPTVADKLSPILMGPERVHARFDWFRQVRHEGFRSTLISGAMAGLAWGFVAGYGCFRLVESEKTMREGPTLAVIQPDVPEMPGVAKSYDSETLLRELQQWSEEAAQNKPHLILWPENIQALPIFGSQIPAVEYTDARARGLLSMLDRHVPESSEALRTNWPGVLLELQRRQQEFVNWVTKLGVPIMAGTVTCEPATATGSPGSAWKRFNTATLFLPKRGVAECQAKMRLFPIGEYIPFSGTIWHDWIERWIAPRRSGFRSVWYQPGLKRRTFQLDSASPSSGRDQDRMRNLLPNSHHFQVFLCNELLFPATVTGTHRGDAEFKRPDFLIGVSNLGSFRRNAALKFSIWNWPFRAVEARLGIACSSNTGISGFAKPTGELYGLVTNRVGESWTGLGTPEQSMIQDLTEWRARHAHQIEREPKFAEALQQRAAQIYARRDQAGVSGWSAQKLYLDRRETIYSRYGDWFGLVALAMLAIGSLLAVTELCRVIPR